MTIELAVKLAARIQIAADNAGETFEEYILAAVEARLINDRNSLPYEVRTK